MRAAKTQVTKSRGKSPHRRHATTLREYIPRLDLTQCLLDAYDHVSRRAHAIYLERGAEEGRELDDWLRAEREYLPSLPVDFQESKKCIHAMAEVPGFDGSEVAIAVESRWLLVRAIRDPKRDPAPKKRNRELAASEKKQRPARGQQQEQQGDHRQVAQGGHAHNQRQLDDELDERSEIGNCCEAQSCEAESDASKDSDRNFRDPVSRGSQHQQPQPSDRHAVVTESRHVKRDAETLHTAGRDPQPANTKASGNERSEAQHQNSQLPYSIQRSDEPRAEISPASRSTGAEGSTPAYMLSIFELSAEVDPLQSVAILSNGLLGIRMPKTAPCAQAASVSS